jgi:hypothetical protein
MLSPEKITITYNAADAVDDFREVGIEINGTYQPVPEHILRAIGNKIGRLYALRGYRVDDKRPIYIKPKAITEHGILFVQPFEIPTFEEIYSVATEPQPQVMAPHGDISFALVRTE